ncbi:hypothetical protein N789_01805 [Arenimonas oryziterrae DSM 21050 = YC6267]|uniref:Uncharacterized protein n=1 Tax=Arenimonas oryziterrae DSM 21050 = YC6267 TaxID=1121015 RepID=A0A091AZN8_9GAMM|nr:hypothetical protein N789_01805 [Arenimonas oryziterrae DSM 21050 = YC6267]
MDMTVASGGLAFTIRVAARYRLGRIAKARPLDLPQKINEECCVFLTVLWSDWSNGGLLELGQLLDEVTTPEAQHGVLPPFGGQSNTNGVRSV